MQLFTSESVTEGHPDKVCDQVSDAVLDAFLAQDPNARVAVETLASAKGLTIAGEFTSTATVDVTAVARDALAAIGYDDPRWGYPAASVPIRDETVQQSPDIAGGVFDSLEARNGSVDPLALQGAGDQGLMFGYATRESSELTPLALQMAHALTARMARLRKDGTLPWMGPDGKAQVTLRFEGGRPSAVDTVLISTQHDEAASNDVVMRDVYEHIIGPVLNKWALPHDDAQFFVNPSGRFVLGGPAADTGLTGRKIIVDTYGGAARHGGGAFSGKDPSKVDRSAAYAMRWVAKNVVAAGLAERCEVQVAYAIGVANPVGVYVDTFGTGVVSDERLAAAVREVFDLRPAAIARDLDLKRPIYLQTAAYGHFGKRGLPWEATDRADALAAAAL